MRIVKLASVGALLVAVSVFPAAAADDCTPELFEAKGKQLDALMQKNPDLASRVPEVVAEVEKDYGGEPTEEKRCEAMDKLYSSLEKLADAPGEVTPTPSSEEAAAEACTEEKIAELGATLEAFVTDNPDLAEQGESIFADVEKKYGGEPPEDKVCEALGEVIAALNALKGSDDCDEEDRTVRQAALGEYLQENPEKTAKMQEAVATVEADYDGEPPLEKQCEALDKLITILKED